jgi:hypothetical protein
MLEAGRTATIALVLWGRWIAVAPAAPPVVATSAGAPAVVAAAAAATAPTPVEGVLAVPVIAVVVLPVVVVGAAAPLLLMAAATALLLDGVVGAVASHVARSPAGVAVAVEARSGAPVVVDVKNLRRRWGFGRELLLGKLKPRLGLHESRERFHALEEFLLQLEVLVEAGDEAQRELFVGDGSADVGQLIGDGLHLAAVRHDSHVALKSVLELLVEADLVALRVLGEEVLEPLSGGVGGAVRRQDNVLQLVGDAGVHPEDDVNVGGVPRGIGEERRRLRLDVIAGVVLGEDGEEEVPPLAVVPGGGVELELDVTGDIDAVGGGRGGQKLD